MKNLIYPILFLCVLVSSCKEDDNNTSDLRAENVFSPNNYFNGTIDGNTFSIVKTDSIFNFSSSSVTSTSTANDTSVVGRSTSIRLHDNTNDYIRISFYQSFQDTALLLNNGSNSWGYDAHSARNPFTNSSNFHDIFLDFIGTREPFYFSYGHGNDAIPKKLYSGLAVELHYQNKFYRSHKNFKSHSSSRSEILAYQIIQKDRIPYNNTFFTLPSGKVKVKFDCVLYEINGTGTLKIENAIYQTDISE